MTRFEAITRTPMHFARFMQVATELCNICGQRVEAGEGGSCVAVEEGYCEFCSYIKFQKWLAEEWDGKEDNALRTWYESM